MCICSKQVLGAHTFSNAPIHLELGRELPHCTTYCFRSAYMLPTGLTRPTHISAHVQALAGSKKASASR